MGDGVVAFALGVLVLSMATIAPPPGGEGGGGGVKIGTPVTGDLVLSGSPPAPGVGGGGCVWYVCLIGVRTLLGFSAT